MTLAACHLLRCKLLIHSLIVLFPFKFLRLCDFNFLRRAPVRIRSFALSLQALVQSVLCSSFPFAARSVTVGQLAFRVRRRPRCSLVADAACSFLAHVLKMSGPPCTILGQALRPFWQVLARSGTTINHRALHTPFCYGFPTLIVCPVY